LFSRDIELSSRLSRTAKGRRKDDDSRITP
jgi:hypothetical protein